MLQIYHSHANQEFSTNLEKIRMGNKKLNKKGARGMLR